MERKMRQTMTPAKRFAETLVNDLGRKEATSIARQRLAESAGDAEASAIWSEILKALGVAQ